jgi:hypothetical protein
MRILRALRHRLRGAPAHAHARPVPSVSLPSVRERWLLVYNCQVLGLANCLNLLSDEIEVEYHDPHSFLRESGDIAKRLDSFDRVLASPRQMEQSPIDLDRHGKALVVPTISFSAYHPDICYLQHEGKELKGPLGDYHSLIAFAAFRSGLDVDATLALYRADTYARLGYFVRWDPARNAMLGSFRKHGFDLAPSFLEWSRAGAFMYSINHPRIACVRDVARAVLARAGIKALYADALPQDNLANGPIFPVYPEIAHRLGVEGSRLFKVGGAYRFLHLRGFVEESFRLYRDAGDINIRTEHAELLDAAMTLIGRPA